MKKLDAKAAGDPMNSPHGAIFILEAAVDCRVPKTLAPAGSQVLETARAENAISSARKRTDFERRSELMQLLWQTWNELAAVEGIRQPGLPAQFKQLGESVNNLFGLEKNFLAGFPCVKHYDPDVFVLPG